MLETQAECSGAELDAHLVLNGERRWSVDHGDNREVLARLPECSIDSCVTDPPYELGFAGRSWDRSGIAYDVKMWRAVFRVLKPGAYLLAFGGTRTVHRIACAIEDAGFEIRDGIEWMYASGFPKNLRISLDPRFCQCGEPERNGEHKVHGQGMVGRTGTAEVLPGGDPLPSCAPHLTHGAPGSLDDYRRADGLNGGPLRRVEGVSPTSFPSPKYAPRRNRSRATDGAPAHGPECIPSPAPHSDRPSNQDSVAHGHTTSATSGNTGVSSTPSDTSQSFLNKSDTCQGLSSIKYGTGLPPCNKCGLPIAKGLGTALKPSREPIIVARKPLDGTVAGNVQKWGTGGLNIDGCRIVTADDLNGGRYSEHGPGDADSVVYGAGINTRTPGGYIQPSGRWPPNAVFTHSPNCGDQCTEDCPVRLLDQQSGDMPAGVSVTTNGGGRIFNGEPGPERPNGGYQDDGSASRIFPQFRFDDGLEFPPFLYHPKAGRAERDRGLERFRRVSGGQATNRKEGSAGLQSPRAGAGRVDGVKNVHPTVKPIGLMRWLCRLVTQPGGICLDPFTGSGTTGCGATLEGFRFVGCELTNTEFEPFVRIARARISAVLAHDFTVSKRPNEHEKQQSLFEAAS